MTISATNRSVFDELLFRLEPGLATPEQRYKHVRHKLVKFFAWRYCEDPEDLADETMSRLLNNTAAGRKIESENPYPYVLGIAKNVFREYSREKRKRDVLTNSWQPLPAPDEDEGECLYYCLRSKSIEDLKLLDQYYATDDNREL